MGAQPSNYKITLEPNLKVFTFTGHEVITLTVDKGTKEILLHVADIKIQSCLLLPTKETMTYEYLPKDQRVKLTLPKAVEGEIQIELAFEGELNDKLAGFYRSEYEEDGEVKYLATTQFEAADARRAFPCFDEPAYKATFDITLIVDKNLTALSNMPVVTEEVVGEKKKFTFATTPIMSTYLVYLGVGEFEVVKEMYHYVEIRGITTKGKSQYCEFALDVAKRSLKFFEEYFDIPYPLPKLDFLAIPDFASGAMENWGAITFRENALLYYPHESSTVTKQRIAEVVAHEIAHQWFGNLVTMKWWNDLWLNESFATFMAYKVLDANWPEWDIWSHYIMDTVFGGMALDSLKSSHPIEVKVENVEQMNELFDEIAYDKGGSILRMLENYMGEDKFRDGLRDYMQNFQYKNTQAKDLWTALEKHAPSTIVPLMEIYIRKVGFPQVMVEAHEQQLKLSQHRFLLIPSSHETTVWNIPLVIKNHDDTKQSRLLNESSKLLSITPHSVATVNENYSGFFITKYAHELQSEIVKHIHSLNSRERMGVIHDMVSLLFSGDYLLTDTMNFFHMAFKDETDVVVLYYLIEKLEHLHLLLPTSVVTEFLRKVAQETVHIVGYEPHEQESTFAVYARNAALSSLSLLHDPEASEFLNKQFEQYLETKKLPNDLRSVVYRHAVWAHPHNYEKVKNLYLVSHVQEEKVKLLSALANSQDHAVVKQTLDFSLSPDVRFANMYLALHSASNNPHGKDVAFTWLLENWTELGKRVGGHGGVLLRRVAKIVLPECGIGKKEKVKKFIQKNKVMGLEKTFEQIMEELEINERFVKKNS